MGVSFSSYKIVSRRIVNRAAIMACMAEQVQHTKSRHATWMFKKYCVNLAVRTALLGLGIYFFYMR